MTVPKLPTDETVRARPVSAVVYNAYRPGCPGPQHLDGAVGHQVEVLFGMARLPVPQQWEQRLNHHLPCD
jgi:hypothetical protein